MNGRSCEAIVDDEVCGGPGYSWSTEHNNSVLCAKCYRQWCKPKMIQQAKDILANLTSAERKSLAEALNSAK